MRMASQVSWVMIIVADATTYLMRMASQPRKGVFAHRGQPCVGLCASWPMRPLEALRDAFLMRMASQVSACQLPPPT